MNVLKNRKFKVRAKREKINSIMVLRTVLLSAIILWLIMIFDMSAKTGTQSAGISKKVVDAVVKIIPGYSVMGEVNRIHFYNRLHTVIRKTAHFTEYGILAILVLGFLLTFSQIKQRFQERKKIRFIDGGVILFCVLCAALDEYHQSFVAGRGPAVGDVFIDTCGAVFFMLFFKIIYIKLSTKKSKECG